MKKKITITIDEDTLTELSKIAKKHRRSLSNLLNVVLVEYIFRMQSTQGGDA